jgi:putative endonuclease
MTGNTPHPRETGDTRERLAARWLQQQGLELLRRNYACRLGEIDLIMRDNDTLVFVEVRYRRNHSHGSPLETVTWRKQRKLWRCARHYLMQAGLHDAVACRFDVVGISSTDIADSPLVEWVRNAFSM